MDLKIKKENAINTYKEAKKSYLENANAENWIRFCDAKRNCRLLGVII